MTVLSVWAQVKMKLHNIYICVDSKTRIFTRLVASQSNKKYCQIKYIGDLLTLISRVRGFCDHKSFSLRVAIDLA